MIDRFERDKITQRAFMFGFYVGAAAALLGVFLGRSLLWLFG